MKKTIIASLRIIISVALIIILLYIMRDKYGRILGALKGTNMVVFAFSFLLFILAITLGSVRLKLIIEAQDIRVTFKEALSLTFIGYFFNNFLPTAIGGDVVKAYHLSKQQTEKMSSFASIFIDRAIGLITMVFMAFTALLFVKDRAAGTGVRYTIYTITAASLFAVIFITNKNIAKKFSILLKMLKPLEETLKKAYNIINKYRHHKALMFQSLAISVISQTLFFLSLGTCVLSIGSRIPIIEIFLRVPIISTLSLLPSINGLGLREGSTVVLFSPFIGKERAFAVSVLWLLILLVISVIGGIIYAASPQFRAGLKKS